MTKVKNIEAIRRRVKKLAGGFTSDKSELTKSAKIIQNELRRTIREGQDADDKDFPDLETKTKNRRGRLSTVNPTSKYYSQGKSNATFTGELVRKIKATVSGRFIEIIASGKHAKYIGVKGKPIGKKKADIADIVRGFADRGVKLMGVTDSAKVKIKNQFKRYLRRRR